SCVGGGGGPGATQGRSRSGEQGPGEGAGQPRLRRPTPRATTDHHASLRAGKRTAPSRPLLSPALPRETFPLPPAPRRTVPIRRVRVPANERLQGGRSGVRG